MWPLDVSSRVTEIAHTIQLAVAPVFLLAAIGQLLNMLAGRLSRVIDRARVLETRFPGDTPADRARMVWELRLLDRRMRIVNRAIFLCTSSAIMICTVVALMFVANLADLRYGRAVATIFIISMVVLVAGLLTFLLEVRVALHANRVRRDFLTDTWSDQRSSEGLGLPLL
jgi:hypothetical protein